jgi:hypothetical protein
MMMLNRVYFLKSLLPGLLLLCLLNVSDAQDIYPKIISPSGRSFDGNNIHLDWTLGEVVISTIENPSFIISQGMHQPDIVITSIDRLPKESGSVQLYPNPTSKYLDIVIHQNNNKKIKVTMIGTDGKMVLEKYYNGLNITDRYSMVGFPSGTYFLTINFIHNSQQIFQIIKTD